MSLEEKLWWEKNSLTCHQKKGKSGERLFWPPTDSSIATKMSQQMFSLRRTKWQHIHSTVLAKDQSTAPARMKGRSLFKSPAWDQPTCCAETWTTEQTPSIFCTRPPTGAYLAISLGVEPPVQSRFNLTKCSPLVPLTATHYRWARRLS